MAQIYSSNLTINSGQEYSFTFECSTSVCYPGISLNIPNVGYVDFYDGNGVVLPTNINDSVEASLYYGGCSLNPSEPK